MVLYDAEPPLVVLDIEQNQKTWCSWASRGTTEDWITDVYLTTPSTEIGERASEGSGRRRVEGGGSAEREQKQAVKNAWWKNYSTKTKLLLVLYNVRGARGTCVLLVVAIYTARTRTYHRASGPPFRIPATFNHIANIRTRAHSYIHTHTQTNT